jgi:CHAT domain-containing protein
MQRTPKTRVWTAAAVAVLLAAVVGGSAAYLLVVRSGGAGRQPIVAASAQNNPHTLLQEANYLFWISNLAAADPFYQRAEELFVARGDARDALYAKIGAMRARAETMSFVDLSEFLGDQLSNPIMKEDPRLTLWCLASKGYTDIEINDGAAEYDWKNAQELARQLGDNAWANRASGELGLIEFLHGNVLRAAWLVGGALLWSMAHHDVGAEIRYLELIAEGMEAMNRHSEGLMFSSYAIKVAKETPNCGFPFMAYETKAEALAGMKRLGEAHATLEEALNRARTEGQRGHEAEIRMTLGEIAEQQHDLAAATKNLELAASTAVSQDFYRLGADAMFDLAAIYRQEGSLDKAEARLRVGLEASEHVRDGYSLPRDLEAMAQIEALNGHPQQADILYQRAEDVIDGMLVETPGAYAESALLNVMSSIYLNHFKLCAAHDDVRAAFETIERARGRTVADFLRNKTRWRQTWRASDVPHDEIAILQEQLLGATTPVERQQILNDLFEAKENQAFRGETRLRAVVQAASTPAPLDALERILWPNELFLEYVLAEPKSFCIVVSRSDAEIVQLGAGRKEIEEIGARFLATLKSQRDAQTQGKLLYQLLLQPVASLGNQRLVIVPDGRLHALPFGALTQPDGRYVLESHVISYVPSATVLEYLAVRQKPSGPPLTFLGVGGVTYQQANSRNGPLGFIYRGLDDLRGTDLSNLPGSRDEVIEANRALGGGGVLLLGSHATRTAFISEPLRKFKILHLALHGVANARFPEESGLAFASGTHANDPRFLQVHDVVRLWLKADLVVLSACDTANGELEGEEGIESLTQSFMVAGARSVVGSLWKADDYAAAELMEDFYAKLARGESVAVALNDAKLSMLAKYGPQALPFYWAGFLVAGNGDQRISVN